MYFFSSSSGLVIILFPISCFSVQILRDGGSVSLPEQVVQYDPNVSNHLSLNSTWRLPEFPETHHNYVFSTRARQPFDVLVSYLQQKRISSEIHHSHISCLF